MLLEVHEGRLFEQVFHEIKRELYENSFTLQELNAWSKDMPPLLIPLESSQIKVSRSVKIHEKLQYETVAVVSIEMRLGHESQQKVQVRDLLVRGGSAE